METMLDPVSWLSGFRIAHIVLYGTLFARVFTFSFEITSRPAEARVRAWRWFRAGLILFSGSVVFFYGPKDLLLAFGLIDFTTERLMSVIGSFLNALAAASLLTGLDVANGNRAFGFPIYCAIIITALIWAETR